MISSRMESILKSIVGQYIIKALPVSSGSLTAESDLNVSSATIRNEMVRLEKEGYIIRPHHSSGSIPLDKGYRLYVDSLGEMKLPLAEQRMISHLFHQVEGELDGWLNLAATMLAQTVKNVALITSPKPENCQFKHMEVVSLQGTLALLVLVLEGARVREQLVNFDEKVDQDELSRVAAKLRDTFAGMDCEQIREKKAELSLIEEKITDGILKEMQAEDSRQNEDSYVEGLHFTLNQPELAQNHDLALHLMELIEQRNLIKNIVSANVEGQGVRVVIGKENTAEVVRDYSVVVSHYGVPGDAVGTISVIGPTRMNYARTIATVEYLSLVMNILVARLYGKEAPAEGEANI